ncbi:MAG: LysE family transporter [Bacteroidota bacterium]|nr:LysE family transporter [Bacteroidota bacterium]MDP4232895.1 LysE family transporter [Bacteroidota bacterium]MDP4241939.1 LysE family transporter [Bacteroidota bacterium]MDP4286842.1 LysE family transporter [Bacteroidota bacterium]
MILAVIVGAITGWLLSMPIGPVNAAAISRTLRYSYRYGLAVGIGAALMDVIYCGGAAQINQFLVESPIINLVFQLVGFAALLWLGLRQLLQKHQSAASPQDDPKLGEALENVAMKKMHIGSRSIAGPFVLGVLLYATNVMAIPEWIIIAGLWRGWGILGTGVDINAAFAVGAGLGTAGWFILLIGWISRRHRGFKISTMKRINLGMGIAMLVFSAYFAYAIIFETHWSSVESHAKEDTRGVMP